MKMLHTTLKTLAFVALCGLAACSDFLEEDPKGQLNDRDFFASKEDLDASLNALYSVVAVSQSQNNYCGTNFLAGDDISTHPASNKQPLREHDQYSVTDNNSWLVSMWEQRYKVIKAANFIINNAARTPGVAEETIRQAIAQAHYWRAYSYFYLVTTWGEVPVMLEEEINYEAPLSSVEDIYALIVSDLKTAEEGCPVMYTSEPYARNGVNIAVSRGAVQATLSYVYMCMAGWPLNKGAEYYRLAADKAEEVIDGVEDGGWPLVRKHQWEASSLIEDVATVVTLDAGNWNDLHPWNKSVVADRLFAAAQRLVYGKDDAPRSPESIDVRLADGRLTITFDDGTGDCGLDTLDGADPGEFELVWEDGSRQAVPASIDGNTVVIAVPWRRPTAVRYAWRNAPNRGLLCGSNGLPVPPFAEPIA